jgi:hypothetical protein
MSSATNPESLRDTVLQDGIAGIPGAFSPAWADRLGADFDTAFMQAQRYEGGTVDRGPQRWYFAVHPAQVRGFVDLITHPAVTELCESVLGPDYQFVELGFDVPLPGAVDQPWHRDFPAPPETAEGRLTSLAFNAATVDVRPDLGPLEIAPGTHWELGDDFRDGMFPGPQAVERYERLAVRKYPRRGDLSARSGLTVHRGTANTSTERRAVLILGAVSPQTDTPVHVLHLTRDEHRALAEPVRRHLRCTVVKQLPRLQQKHAIDGLAGPPSAGPAPEQ